MQNVRLADHRGVTERRQVVQGSRGVPGPRRRLLVAEDLDARGEVRRWIRAWKGLPTHDNLLQHLVADGDASGWTRQSGH